MVCCCFLTTIYIQDCAGYRRCLVGHFGAEDCAIYRTYWCFLLFDSGSSCSRKYTIIKFLNPKYPFNMLSFNLKVAIELVTYWDDGFGKGNWMIWKNVVVVAFGILALVFGSKSAIEDIFAQSTEPIVSDVFNNVTTTVASAFNGSSTTSYN